MATFGKLMTEMCRKGLDLTVRQFALMAVMHENAQSVDARQVKNLAKTLDISKPAVTRALNRLVNEGLAMREAIPADRRGCAGALTPEGRKRWVAIEKQAVKAAA